MARGSSAILAVKIIGDASGAKKAFDETETGAGRLGSAFKKAGPIVGAAVVAGAAAGAKALWDIGTTWEEVQNDLRVSSGAVGEDFENLFGSVKSVASQIPGELTDIGTVVGDVNTRFGLTGDTLETVSKQYLEAGRILGTSVDIEKTSGAMALFGIEGENVSGALDDLFRVSQATGVGMNELTSGIASSGATIKTLGFSFEESVALTGNLGKAGLNTSKVFEAMRSGMGKLAAAGEAPAEGFNRIVGEIDGFIATGNEAAALDLAREMFGIEAAPQFVAAVQQGIIGVEDMMAAAGTSKDTILGLGQETMTTSEKFDVLKNRAMVALEPIAGEVVDGVGAAMDWFMNLIETTDWTPFQEGAAKAGELISGLWPVIQTAGELIQELLPVVKTIFDSIAKIIKPALKTIQAVIDTVLAAINGDWSGAWEGVKKIVSGAWDTIKAIVSGAINVVKSIVEALGLDKLFDNALAAASRAVDRGIEKVMGWFRNLPQNILGALGSLDNLLSNAGRAIIDGFTGGLRRAWDRGKKFVSGIADWIRNNKGPISKDRVLLAPAGRAIMGGFVGSLRDQIPALERWVEAASDTIAGLSAAPTVDLSARMPSTVRRGHGEAAPIQINVTGALDPAAVARQIRDLLTHDARIRGVVDLTGVVLP